ncbi:TPA: hypothetical protein ACH3X3_015163 [Trebouxia sp. C0006]
MTSQPPLEGVIQATNTLSGICRGQPSWGQPSTRPNFPGWALNNWHSLIKNGPRLVLMDHCIEMTPSTVDESVLHCCCPDFNDPGESPRLAKGPSGDKDWWAQKTNPSFPSAPIADSSATTSTSSAASSAAGPKQNPFLKGGSQEETRVRDAPVPGSKKQTGDQKNPRKEFEAGLMGAAQGVFSFFNKPGQKGQQGQQGQQGGRRTPQTNSSHAKEEDARAVNEDWGNQQAREGEFRVPHQEQSNLDPYSSPQSSEEEVRYPTIGQRKPAAAKASKADISKELEDLEMEVQGSGSRRR